MQLNSDVHDATEAKDYDGCLKLYQTARAASEGVWDNDEIRR